MWGVGGRHSTENRRPLVWRVMIFSGSIGILCGFVPDLRADLVSGNSQGKILSPRWGWFVFQLLPTACAVGCILTPLRGLKHVMVVLKSATGVLNGLGFKRRLGFFQGLTARLKPCPPKTHSAENFSAREALRYPKPSLSAASEADSLSLFRGKRRSVAGTYWGDGAGTSGLGAAGAGTSGLGAAGCRPRASKVRVFASP